MNSQKFKRFLANTGNEYRSLNADESAKGGDTIPIDFNNKIIGHVEALGGIASLSTVVYGVGETKAPTSDGANEIGQLIGFIGDSSEIEPEFGEVTLKPAQLISSGTVRASNNFIQDESIDFEEWLSTRFAIRIQRRESTLILNGTGVGKQPLGINNLITNELQAASATVITVDDIENLINTIPAEHRLSPSFGLAINANTLKLIRKEAASNLLLALDLSVNKIAGYKFIIDKNISDVGTGNRSVFAGDWSKFLIKRSHVRFKAIREAFAEFDQTGYVAVQKTDFDIEDQAAFAALKH
jgi:HK97 family phage major capsid protein